MATKISAIYTLITADDKPLKRGLRRAQGEAVKGAARIQKALNKINFRAIGLGAAAFGGAIALSMNKAVNAASDLEEATGKFNVVFRDQLTQAETWSRGLVAAYGLSTREAKTYMAMIQDTLKPMGVASDEAARLSNEVVKLAVDLGSFNNQKTPDVMRDIQSALVGNFETMKKYSSILNVARIRQEALRQGLIEGKEELTAAQKATVAYTLMVKDSADAIGDWSRTSSGYANTMKQMRSNIEEVSAKIGNPLMPAIADVVKEFNRWVTTNNKLIDQDIPSYTRKTGAALLTVVDSFTKLVAIYDKFPSGTTAAATGGILGFMLFGKTGPAALIGALATLSAIDISKNWELWKKAFDYSLFGEIIGGFEQATDRTNEFLRWLGILDKKLIEVGSNAGEALHWSQIDIVPKFSTGGGFGADRDRDAKLAAKADEARKKHIEQVKKLRDEYVATLPVISTIHDSWKVFGERTFTDEQIDKIKRLQNEYISTLPIIKTYRDSWEVSGERTFTDEQIEKAEQMRASTEKAFTGMLELSERTAWSMQETFSDVFYDGMRGKLTSFSDYFNAFLDTMQRSWADVMGQMATEWIFGQDMKGGGALETLFKYLGGLGGSAGGTSTGPQIGGATTYPSNIVLNDGGYIGEGVHGIGMSSGKSYEFHPGEFVIPTKDVGQPLGDGGDSTVNVFNIQALDAPSVVEVLRRSGAVPMLVSENLNDNSYLRTVMRETL